MEVSFKRNGKLYNQYFAWIPARVSSGQWVWLTTYYSRETKKDGWVTMTPWEFFLDSNRGE